MIISLLVSWLVANALGLLFTWLLRAKAAGFCLGYAVVIVFWLIVWIF
ncbi:hypothetical protein ACEOHC_003872 [Salmonella enterica]